MQATVRVRNRDATAEARGHRRSERTTLARRSPSLQRLSDARRVSQCDDHRYGV